MKTVHVSAAREYDVMIGSGLLKQAGSLIRTSVPKAKILALIAGSNVWPLYGPQVQQTLEESGFTVVHYVYEAGEQSKTLETFCRLVNFMAENHLSRTDAAVALGGGVTGDMVGFAASAYMRGIEFVQIPTTLLAAVDSSVGGKTAVDLPSGKNLCGAFWQPSLVLCDTDTFATLPQREMTAGCAEVIKYSVLESRDFFNDLRDTPVTEQAEQVIETCVRMKRDVVNEDEFDRGARAFLNLGHTFGHAVEKCGNFTIPHGFAVSIGMCIIARAAVKRGICRAGDAEELIALLQQYGLPTEAPFTAEELFQAALSDKKIAGGTLSLIVPETIGQCRLVKISASEALDWLHDGGIQ